jgi:hypothetical protein
MMSVDRRKVEDWLARCRRLATTKLDDHTAPGSIASRRTLLTRERKLNMPAGPGRKSDCRPQCGARGTRVNHKTQAAH